AVNYEINRQIELLEKGEEVVQETRGWDEAKQKTTGQRGKEEAHDYRYMPEPDIPPVELEDEFLEKIKSKMPPLPTALRDSLVRLDISPKVVEDILELPPTVVSQIRESIEAAGPPHARRLAFWALETGELDVERDIELSKMLEDGRVSGPAAKAIREEMATSDQSPEEIAENLNLLQVSDESAIEKIVEEVISENPKAAEDVKNGEAKAIGFLVGQVMAKSKGQANPALAQQIIKKRLGTQ
ncbi:MAG TPA: Asp-tRNA(Asn)/Glu-tRNA(Gln) amidotransferase subunit GatB, partial [Candidatus Saccharimonadales bacterium]|nr:Asp-tRNA(Asn)/Glu-tRNA(Gln) amidotransferase subunit GatB [Candidatus Saccharimonadales bacterium]